MGTRRRKKIERHLPPVGTNLVAQYKKKQYQAKIVKNPDFPEGKAVSFDNVLYRSLTGAAKAITKVSWNGWIFWKVRE